MCVRIDTCSFIVKVYDESVCKSRVIKSWGAKDVLSKSVWKDMPMGCVLGVRTEGQGLLFVGKANVKACGLDVIKAMGRVVY